jgi:hypothetical protein
MLPAGSDTWTPNIEVTDDLARPMLFWAVAADSAGNVYAIWEDNRDDRYDIYYAKLPAGSNVWSTSSKVNDDPPNAADQYAVDLAVDGAGNVYAVWEQWHESSETWAIYSAVLPAGSDTWSASVQVNDVDPQAIWDPYPAIDVDQAGNAYAVWTDWRGGYLEDSDIYMSVRDAETGVWGPSERVNAAAGAPAALAEAGIAVDGTGNVHVVWEDSRDFETYEQDIYYTRIPGLGPTKHYYANGQRIATRVGGTLYYVHQDLLGSTVAVSDDTGQPLSRSHYLPYGEVYQSQY